MHFKSDEKVFVGIENNIPIYEKILLSLGAGLSTFYYIVITNWLFYFYTDIFKLSSKYVGIMMLVVRIISAVFLLMVGILMDQRATKWGKYKPWLSFSWLCYGISGYFLFQPIRCNIYQKMVYATITFTFFTLTTPINSIAGTGFGITITKRNDDRLQLSFFSYLSILLFSIIASVFFLPLVNILGYNNFEIGISKLMLIIMVIAFIQGLAIFIVMNERFFLTQKKGNTVSFVSNLKIIVKNKYFLISLIYNFALQLFSVIRMAISVYYYKYLMILIWL